LKAKERKHRKQQWEEALNQFDEMNALIGKQGDRLDKGIQFMQGREEDARWGDDEDENYQREYCGYEQEVF